MQDWVTKDRHDDWVAMVQQVFILQQHRQCAYLFYLHQTSSPAIIRTGSADIFTIKHVWLCDTWPVHMSETKQFCSVTASPDQPAYCSTHVFKICSYVLQLHPSTWHVDYNCTLTACMSVRIASHQQICLNQLQLTSKHICCCQGWTIRYICYTCLISAIMSLCSYPINGLVSTLAPDHQACMLQLHLTTAMSS